MRPLLGDVDLQRLVRLRFDRIGVLLKAFGRDVGVQLSLRGPVKPSAGSLVALKARTLRGAAVVIRAVRDIEMIIRPTLTPRAIVRPQISLV